MTETPKIRRGPVLIEVDSPLSESGQKPSRPTIDVRGSEHADAPPDLPPKAQRGDGRDRRPPRDHDAPPMPSPADAPLVDDGRASALPTPRAMMLMSRIAGRKPSRVTRLFIGSGVALFTFILSVAALRFLSQLLITYPLLGWIGIGLAAAFSLAALAMGWREYRAWSRFATIDHIRRDAGHALTTGDVLAAQKSCDHLTELYAKRPEMADGRATLARHRADAFDAQSLLALAETNLLADLDQHARREVEAAARTVAAATALIPLALVDVIAAFAANLRMIRRLAEIYGGRAGSVGGWRLMRTVLTHLIATGAVAAGDDLIQTVAGGGLLSRVSRRFGEGVVNGALTARVGIAAIEVCRPLPFIHQPKPTVGGLVSRGLKGLFGTDEPAEKSPRPQD